jgi:hypothetical protein
MSMMPREQLDAEGFLVVRRGLGSAHITAVRSAGNLDVDGAGTRNLLSLASCRAMVSPLRELLVGNGLMAPDAVAVQCTLFKKTSSCNWKVALHQDLAIPVLARVEHPDLSGWSAKEGTLFVQPPVLMLQKMLAVRLHLDTCSAQDGPLRVVPRSHRHGRLAPGRVLCEHGSPVECTADTGDLLLMRPLLLHASSKASSPTGSRRVLHFLFGPVEPGYGLQWSMAA